MSWRIEPKRGAAGLEDIIVRGNGKVLPMLGKAGPNRELGALDPLIHLDQPTHDTLPVLVGSGLGHALEKLLSLTSLPIAIVDKEQDILEITGLREHTASQIRWITCSDAKQAIKELTVWQDQNGGKPFLPLINPFYLRLDPGWYKHIQTVLSASNKFDFWKKAATPRFKDKTPRVLLITSKYFLVGEMVDACKRLGLPNHLLTIEDEYIAGSQFVEQLLNAVITFRPDCVLTMNHLGVDREGVLVDLLARLRLPMGSWFVDNPHLILHLYEKLVNPWTVIFTWDADNLPSLKEMGFEYVRHLPLGTDPDRFKPVADKNPPHRNWRADVSFVGNSMIYKVGKKLASERFPRALIKNYRAYAAEFGQNSERSVREYILRYPNIAPHYQALPSNEARLSYEAMLTWEATRQYRAKCVEQTLPFNPLIVGDSGWNIQFRHTGHAWRMHRELSYYSDLPRFYPWSTINFNCTSKQMKGAVNQRVFDVPAAGAFVLTDWREQMDALFEPGKEIICYREPEEAGDLIRYFLRNPEKRLPIMSAARRRVLAEHTWDHRIKYMLDTLRDIFG